MKEKDMKRGTSMSTVNDKSSIVPELWNSDITSDNYGSKEQFYEHLFEQYKMFVEMADRVSSRRTLANTFFLTLHTLLVTSAGFVYESGPKISNRWINIFPLFAFLALCYVWWRLIHSYRQLNKAKYTIIGEFERKLPSSPYWKAEWELLGKGKDKNLYRPLTDVENWVPVIFGSMYILAFLGILILG